MRTISVKRFKALIRLDPNWASTITIPIMVNGYCDMRGSNIQSLSPLLHFRSRKRDDHSHNEKSKIGQAANFGNCRSLKTAAGTFQGSVDFQKSGITEIHPDFEVTQPDNDGFAASFLKCEHLKTATGKYNGRVLFTDSGVETIRNFKITADSKSLREELAEDELPTRTATLADFSWCPVKHCPMEHVENPLFLFSPEAKAHLIAHHKAKISIRNRISKHDPEIEI